MGVYFFPCFLCLCVRFCSGIFLGFGVLYLSVVLVSFRLVWLRYKSGGGFPGEMFDFAG